MPPRFPQTIALRPRRALSALVLAAVILGAAGPATADALGIDIDGSVSSTTNRAPSFGATPTITVTDENEPPLAPGAPAVGRVVGSLTSLAVRWTAPDNTGRPRPSRATTCNTGRAGNPGGPCLREMSPTPPRRLRIC